jgi:uncharacterized metal-binding protein
VDALSLVYACSGSSSAAQLANDMAVRSVGTVNALVHTAHPRGRERSTHPDLRTLPACCVRACLDRGVATGTELGKHEHAVRKVKHGEFNPNPARALFAHCRELLRPATAGLA